MIKLIIIILLLVLFYCFLLLRPKKGDVNFLIANFFLHFFIDVTVNDSNKNEREYNKIALSG